MIQQTALMLVAGLIFLFFFTPDDARIVKTELTVSLLALLTFVPGLLSYLLGRRAIKRLANDHQRRVRQLQNSKRYTLIFGAMVLAGFVFEVYYLQLPVLVNRVFAFWKFANSRTLIGIIPLIIAILLTRMAIFELDRQVRNTSWNKRQFLNLNLKLMFFPLSPFIIYLFIGDFVEHSPMGVRMFFISKPYMYWIIMLAIIAIMYVMSPSFIRRIWATHPLPDGELRSRIELMARKENIRYRDVLVWDTAGGRIANAGMAGLMPISRYVFLTNSLLDDFTMDEIETIVAHEFGHIKYRHMLLYLVLSLGYMVFYSLSYIRILPVIRGLHLGTTAIAFFSAAATLLAFCTYFILIFRFLSRRFERQSDLYAVDITGKPEVFKSALVKLSAVNYTPSRVSRLVELVRTHPSISRRLEFVDRGVGGYADAERYRRPIFRAGRVSILVLLALILLFAVNKEALLPASEIHYETGRQYAIAGSLFGVELGAKTDLNNGVISEELRAAFKNNKISLSDAAAAIVKEVDARWLITDGDKTYIINRRADGLNIYIEDMLDKAIAEFRMSKRMDLQNQHVHYALGVLYYEKGLVEEAIKELERALQIDPEYVRVQEQLKRILSRQGSQTR